MKVVKETKNKIIWEYNTAIERNEHINSYALLHTLTKAYGDGIKKPLRAEFNKEMRKISHEKDN